MQGSKSQILKLYLKVNHNIVILYQQRSDHRIMTFFTFGRFKLFSNIATQPLLKAPDSVFTGTLATSGGRQMVVQGTVYIKNKPEKILGFNPEKYETLLQR